MHTVEEIVNKLQVQVPLSQDQAIAQVTISLVIIEQAYRRWRKKMK